MAHYMLVSSNEEKSYRRGVLEGYIDSCGNKYGSIYKSAQVYLGKNINSRLGMVRWESGLTSVCSIGFNNIFELAVATPKGDSESNVCQPQSPNGLPHATKRMAPLPGVPAAPAHSLVVSAAEDVRPSAVTFKHFGAALQQLGLHSHQVIPLSSASDWANCSLEAARKDLDLGAGLFR